MLGLAWHELRWGPMVLGKMLSCHFNHAPFLRVSNERKVLVFCAKTTKYSCKRWEYPCKKEKFWVQGSKVPAENLCQFKKSLPQASPNHLSPDLIFPNATPTFHSLRSQTPALVAGGEHVPQAWVG